MKRKPPPRDPAAQDPVIDKKLLESARQTLQTDKLKRVTKCVVCGSNCAPNSAEGLCWVCRRLKISAWRESDQPAAQE
jgi:rubrerythrin